MKRLADLTATSLSEISHIGPKRAQATMDTTTQGGMRSEIMPLIRRYQYDWMYHIKQLQGRFGTETFFDDMKSLCGNTWYQVYPHKYNLQPATPRSMQKGTVLGNLLIILCMTLEILNI